MIKSYLNKELYGDALTLIHSKLIHPDCGNLLKDKDWKITLI